MQSRFALRDFINSLVLDDEIIDSAQMVSDRYFESTALRLNIHYVREVMKQDCGLKFKKIKMISVHENSIHNLIIR